MAVKKRTKRPLILFVCLLLFLVVMVIRVLNHRGRTDIHVPEGTPWLEIYSDAFPDGGAMPREYTGDGADHSPGLRIQNLSEEAVSLAVIMDDLDIPVRSNFTHWVIWNIPPTANIPEAIPEGESVPGLGGARQGSAYGQHVYSGPDPPFGTHRYQFHVFALSSMLDLPSSGDKQALLAAMEGYIVQYGTYTGWYPSAP